MLRALLLAVTVAGLGVWVVSPELAQAQQAPRDQIDPVLATGTSPLVLWTEDRGEGSRVYARRLHENGLPIGGTDGRDFEVTTFPANNLLPPTDPTAIQEPVITTAADDYAPDVLGPLDLGGLLVWTTDALDTGPDPWAQRYSVNELTRGRPFLLAGGQGVQSAPTVIGKVNNRDQRSFFVAWQDDRSGSLDVYSVELGRTGPPLPNVRALASD